MAKPKKIPHTILPHWLIKEIISRDFTKNELKILLLTIRLTFGCHEEEAIVRKVNFTVMGIPQTDVGRIILRLREKNILLARSAEDKHAAISINADTKKWLIKENARWNEKNYKRLIHKQLWDDNQDE
jgi:hypothetical protein